MSLFQCDKCGCLENTSLTGAYHCMGFFRKRPDGIYEQPSVVHGYRTVLGLKENEEFGCYCSACNPIWYTESGHYGVGPRPPDYTKRPHSRDDSGVWHGQFDRRFLPKGMFHTDGDGNLAHVITLEYPAKYELDAEDPLAPSINVGHPQGRLPRPSEKAESKTHIETMSKVYDIIMAEDQTEERRRSVVMAAVKQYIDHGFEVKREQEDRDERRRMMAKAALEAGVDKFSGRQAGKQTRRNNFFAAASAMALGAGMDGYGFGRRPVQEPRQSTPEEIERAKEQGAQRIAMAEEKRRRKAEKRVKYAANGTKS